MAQDAGHRSEQGSTDISDHVRTWHGFVRAIQWIIAANVIVLGLLAIFRTHG